MPEADSAIIYRELGGIVQSLKDIERRLAELEEKQDKFNEAANDIKHMRNNIAMMKGPVEDYKKLKQQGIGGWSVIVMLAGAATTIFNIVSYIVRVYLLGIGNG